MRQTTAPDRTPVQQSMTVMEQDYGAALNSTKLFLGVVLEVQQADGLTNRVADQYEDRRGYLHTCTVRVIEDGSGSGSVDLINVVITPDRRTGILDYSEDLPRPTTCSVYGDTIDGEHHRIDPYALDGDWCIVGFLGGQLDLPFIVRWWPHARNVFDPATCEEGNPDILGNGQALDQTHRYFNRVNGVETVITGIGDVYLSTVLAGSTLDPGGTPKNGRFARKEVSEGGSIRVDLKSSKILELNWNFPEDGIGVDNVSDPSLPQTNPQSTPPFSIIHNGVLPRPNTYHRMDGTSIFTEIPPLGTIKLINHGNTDIEMEDDCIIKIGPGLIPLNPFPKLEVTATGVINLTSPQMNFLVGTVDSPPLSVAIPEVVLGAGVGTVHPLLPIPAIPAATLMTSGIVPFWVTMIAVSTPLAVTAATAVATVVSTPTPVNNSAAIIAIGAWLAAIQANLVLINANMLLPIGQTQVTKAN